MNDVVGAGLEAPQGKIWLMDYERTIVRVSGLNGRDNWEDFFDAALGNYQFARHRGQVNTLFNDGSVRAFFPKAIHPDIGPQRRALWGVEP